LERLESINKNAAYIQKHLDDLAPLADMAEDRKWRAIRQGLQEYGQSQTVETPSATTRASAKKIEA